MTEKIRKTCALDSSPDIKAFIAGQKNFSRSIRVLIQQCIIAHHGDIVDVSEEFEREMHQQLLRQKTQVTPSSQASQATAILPEHQIPIESPASMSVQRRHLSSNDTREPIGFRTHMTQNTQMYPTTIMPSVATTSRSQPKASAFYYDEDDIPKGYDI